MYADHTSRGEAASGDAAEACSAPQNASTSRPEDDVVEPAYADQRKRVIEDVASWKVEADPDITDDELSDFVDHLTELGPKDLRSWWSGTVGEWIAARQDVTVHPDECFERLLTDDDRPYGFVQWVEISGRRIEPEE